MGRASGCATYPASVAEPDRAAAPYDARGAWRRAFVYFLICWLLAAGSGALAGLPGATPTDDRGWWVWTVAGFVVVIVGYWIVWPLGTLTHGRPLDRPAVLAFGLAWGVSEGLLLLSVWTAADRWLAFGWALTVTLLVCATFLGLWHALYWDLKVAPEHNIEAWNLRKVLFVHVPNLGVTVPYLAVYGSGAFFVAMQTVGLLGATRAMHFPRPTPAVPPTHRGL